MTWRPGTAHPDLTRMRFGLWLVVWPAKDGAHQAYVCRCACGKVAIVRAFDLLGGTSESCNAAKHWKELGKPKPGSYRERRKPVRAPQEIQDEVADALYR
jgi:hypothetical protein